MMIATGGLLRISRRQDSLRAKNRAENKRRRKAKRKRKNDIVVVKGKLKLFSVSGLLAAIGVLILMVGITLAVMGYWPKENSLRSQISQRAKSAAKQSGQFVKSPRLTSNLTSNKLWAQTQWNRSEPASNTTAPVSRPVGLLEGLFSGFLRSDRLKVFGPLVMGIGIFVFICANAVLHENRDKKTKIINLRDIYSTVIDAHSLRTKECSPFNGLLSCAQSRTGEMKSGAYGAAMPSRGSWPSTFSCKGGEYRRPSCARKCSWTRERQSFTDAIYSIYKDQNRFEEPVLTPKEWETRSIVTSSVNAFTLPVIKLNNREVEGREERQRGFDEEVSLEKELRSRRLSSGDFGDSGELCGGTAMQTKAEVSRAGLSLSQESKLSDEVRVTPTPQQPQLLLPSSGVRVLGSHLSLNALSDLGTGRHEERSRRFSCPRLDRSGSKGYIKLAELGGDSFEAPDGPTEPDTDGPVGAEMETEGSAMSLHTVLRNSLTQIHTDPTISNSQTTAVDLDPKANL